jgi:hypothetical protein
MSIIHQYHSEALLTYGNLMRIAHFGYFGDFCCRLGIYDSNGKYIDVYSRPFRVSVSM